MVSIKMFEEKYRKECFHEAFKKSIEAGNSNEVYTFEMLQALRDMAERDVYPDGNFSDMDCCVWSMFHSFHMRVEEF